MRRSFSLCTKESSGNLISALPLSSIKQERKEADGTALRGTRKKQEAGRATTREDMERSPANRTECLLTDDGN